MSIEHKCGICGEQATVGPFAGGPIVWYCEECHWRIQKFCEALEKHREFWRKLGKQRKLVEEEPQP